jgi:hypothetical protein
MDIKRNILKVTNSPLVTRNLRHRPEITKGVLLLAIAEEEDCDLDQGGMEFGSFFTTPFRTWSRYCLYKDSLTGKNICNKDMYQTASAWYKMRIKVSRFEHLNFAPYRVPGNEMAHQWCGDCYLRDCQAKTARLRKLYITDRNIDPRRLIAEKWRTQMQTVGLTPTEGDLKQLNEVYQQRYVPRLLIDTMSPVSKALDFTQKSNKQEKPLRHPLNVNPPFGMSHSSSSSSPSPPPAQQQPAAICSSPLILSFMQNENNKMMMDEPLTPPPLPQSDWSITKVPKNTPVKASIQKK